MNSMNIRKDVMTNETLELSICGMTCVSFGKTVQRALLQALGVTSADIDWLSGTGKIVIDPGVTDAEQVLQNRVFHERSGLHAFTAKLNDFS